MANIAVAHTTTPFISVYPWTGAFGTKVSDPATLPTNTGNGVAFTTTSGVSLVPFRTRYEPLIAM